MMNRAIRERSIERRSYLVTDAFPTPPPNSTPRPRLRRSVDDRVLSGVAGGLAEYFDIDPTLVRVAWFVFALVAGSGGILYLLLWAIVPDETGERASLPLVVLALVFFVPFVCAICAAMTGMFGAIVN
jgi:phage shock protein PspC (stress-responsive transcriptional regulator)